MKIRFTILLIFLINSTHLFSQNLEYFETESERYWGINKNSWGGLIGGGVLKFSTKVSDNMYKTIGFELVNIKHPKENKYSSALGYGRTFVWGKKNYLYSLRGQYGRELILVRKKISKELELIPS